MNSVCNLTSFYMIIVLQWLQWIEDLTIQNCATSCSLNEFINHALPSCVSNLFSQIKYH